MDAAASPWRASCGGAKGEARLVPESRLPLEGSVSSPPPVMTLVYLPVLVLKLLLKSSPLKALPEPALTVSPALPALAPGPSVSPLSSNPRQVSAPLTSHTFFVEKQNRRRLAFLLSAYAARRCDLAV